jgi:hypothetical protein
MVEKTLDQKIANIRADSSCRDFILADAKDADMAFGLAAPGKSPEHHGHEGRFRTLAEYRQHIRENVQSGMVDIMLMSASTCEVMAIHEGLFRNSPVTPAARSNDTTDIFVASGSQYSKQPSRPFRTATIDHIMCGKSACEPHERTLGADLGLYSLTFNNDVTLDLPALEQYKAYRLEAEAKGFRHFLEVFDPNAVQAPIEDLGRFVNDMIARTLAGVTSIGRPLFLKIAYHGPAAMEALATYDPNLIPGILGGSAGTTFDAFHMLWEAKKHGARAALYGRKINNAEHQLSFIKYLRAIADDQISPEEAVRAYHGDLQKLGITPYRSLEEDLKSGEQVSAYGGTTRTTVVVPGGGNGSKPANTISNNGQPDFARMTPDEKIAWNRAKWNRILG